MAGKGESTGMGVQLQRSNGATPPEYISVLGIKNVSGPDMSRDVHDVTDMDSGTFREFIGGLVDAGEVSFEANFLPREASQNQSDGGFMAEFDRGSCDTRARWRILLPECEGEPSAYFEFDGIVTGQQVELPMDDVMGFTGSIKVSGRPVLTVEQLSSSAAA